LGANIAPFHSLPTSLARSMILSCPPGSKKPASPVWNQPSASIDSAVASGRL
jgi:hypothetical protein